VIEIATAAGLQAIRNDLVGHYRLVADIDASETKDWNGGDGFAPIGECASFHGTLDGGGHAIRNLFVKRVGEDWVGLFGSLGSQGEIRNVTLVDVRVSGKEDVGGLVGSNCGSITGCDASGEVSGDKTVGGLVAVKGPRGTVTQSYWDVQTTGAATSFGGEGKTSAEMRRRATFVGWDFEKTWQIDEGQGYPTLRCLAGSTRG
jgi:hypothetical protein